MKEIQLTQKQVALVDDDMYEELNRFRWYAHKRHNIFYAARMSSYVNGKRYAIHMHHEIIGRPPKGYMPDHKNGRGIDNRRENLRFVTNRQNQQNIKNVRQSSQYPGVCWDVARKKWKSKITIDGKCKNLGRYEDEYEAFEVYRKAVNALGETVIDEEKYLLKMSEPLIGVSNASR